MKKDILAHPLYILCFLALALCAMSFDSPQDSASLLKSKGDVCYNAGRYSEALEYYTTGLDKAKQERNDNTYYACTGQIGNVYACVGDYKRALHYYKLGYNAAKAAKNEELEWKAISNIVAIYCLVGDARNARSFFNLQTHLSVKDLTLKRYYFLYNQGLIAQTEGKWQIAEYYHKQALDYANAKALVPPYIVSQFIELGNLQLKQSHPAEAIKLYYEAQSSADSMQNKSQLIGIYHHMAEAYQALQKPDSVLKYKNLYLALSDSVFNISQFNMAGSKLFEYENAENQKRIDSLTSQNYVQLVVIIVFVALVVLLVALYVALLRKNRTLHSTYQLLVSKSEDLMLSNKKNKQLLQQYVSEKDAQQATAQLNNQLPGPKEKRSDIGLDEEQKNRLLDSIITVIEDTSVISRPDFSLASLAERIGSNTRYVSWVINDTYNKNFKTLINEQRIREACRRLADREHYANMTMQAIYEEVGFNSAASFIQAFKKVCGMTPSMYQKLVTTNEPDAD